MREIATTREAAAFLRLSPRTLERWRYLGCGPPYLKLGGRCVYDLAALDGWVAAQERGAPSVRRYASSPRDEGLGR